VFLAYEGFELIANASDRIQNPRRTLPIAYYGSTSQKPNAWVRGVNGRRVSRGVSPTGRRRAHTQTNHVIPRFERWRPSRPTRRDERATVKLRWDLREWQKSGRGAGGG
jgi:hypothetical protein